MVNCAVKGCGSKSQSKSGVSFYRFPARESLFKAWVEFCERVNPWTPSKHSRICSIHFDCDSYEDRLDIKKLKVSAVPSGKFILVFKYTKICALFLNTLENLCICVHSNNRCKKYIFKIF